MAFRLVSTVDGAVRPLEAYKVNGLPKPGLACEIGGEYLNYADTGIDYIVVSDEGGVDPAGYIRAIAVVPGDVIECVVDGETATDIMPGNAVEVVNGKTVGLDTDHRSRIMCVSKDDPNADGTVSLRLRVMPTTKRGSE